jgi:hypothetical protein
MIFCHISGVVKVVAIPLVHLLNQSTLLVENEIYDATERERLAGGFLARQVLEEGAAVDGADAAPASAIGHGFITNRALDFHDEIRNRGPPDVEVASQDREAAAADLEGVVDVGCRRGVKGEPDGRVGGGPGSGPAVGNGA